MLRLDGSQQPPKNIKHVTWKASHIESYDPSVCRAASSPSLTLWFTDEDTEAQRCGGADKAVHSSRTDMLPGSHLLN